MRIERSTIEGILLLTPTKHSDDRGFFSEVFRSDVFAAEGIQATFVQDNHALSAQRGILRGLHFQAAPHAQGKLIRCSRGAILDVAVDIRHASPTYGRHLATEVSAANWRQIWIPPGFAHGYLTLEPDCEVLYRMTDYYDPASDRGIAWDDPDLGIDWRLPAASIVLSDKDRRHPRLADIPPVFRYPA
jgi:dTDP-4-dehydrorhamnose 3,5-epimerase